MNRQTPDATPHATDTSTSKPGTRLAANVAYVTVSFVVTSACMFVTDLLIIAGYGRGRHDQATVLLSVAVLGAVLCDLGLASKAGVRRIARSRSDSPELVGPTVGLLLVTLGVAAVGVGAVVGLGAGWFTAVIHEPTSLIRQSAVWLMAGAGIRVCAMVSISFERMANLILISSATEVLRLIWTAACVAGGWPMAWLYAGWTVAWVAALMLCIVVTIRLLTREKIRLAFACTPKQIAGVVREGLPYQMTMLSAQGMPAIVFLLVGALLTGEESIGQVSVLRVTFSLAMVMRIISQSMATSLFPVVARVKAGGGGVSLATTFDHMVSVLGVAVTGLYAGFWAFGRTGLAWIGPEYVQGWPALMVLTLAMGVECYRVQIDQLLMGDRYVWTVAWLEFFKLVLVSSLVATVAVAWGASRVDLSVAAAVAAGVALTAGARLKLARQRVDSIGASPALRAAALLTLITITGCLPMGPYLVIPVWAAGVVVTKLADLQALGRLLSSFHLPSAR